jgi:hypothetical protein
LEERRAQELEWRRRLAEPERRAWEILAQEEVARGDKDDVRTSSRGHRRPVAP